MTFIILLWLEKKKRIKLKKKTNWNWKKQKKTEPKFKVGDGVRVSTKVFLAKATPKSGQNIYLLLTLC